jgi:protein gp37
MAQSRIEWTEVTWNPLTGCDRISPGCDRCYALILARRLKAMGQPKYQHDGDPRTSGPGFGVTMHPGVLAEPLAWRTPRTVFVNSMSDLGHARVSRPFAARMWAVMALTRRHTFQVLTKRPKRLAGLLADPGFVREVGQAAGQIIAGDPGGSMHVNNLAPGRSAGDLDVSGASENWSPRRDGPGRVWVPPWPLPNVWVGTSVELDEYTWRADVLQQAPAAVRFLSLEPLLGPLPSLDLTGIDWVIVGGESGPGFRPLDLDWARDIRDRCVRLRIPLFVKQIGGLTSKAGGRQLDGRTWDQYPASTGGAGPSMTVSDVFSLDTSHHLAGAAGTAAVPGARRCGR